MNLRRVEKRVENELQWLKNDRKMKRYQDLCTITIESKEKKGVMTS